MKLEELNVKLALSMIGWLIEHGVAGGVVFPCRRGHHYCTTRTGYYCIDEAFEALAKYRRETRGLSAPATPSGSIKAT